MKEIAYVELPSGSVLTSAKPAGTYDFLRGSARQHEVDLELLAFDGVQLSGQHGPEMQSQLIELTAASPHRYAQEVIGPHSQLALLALQESGILEHFAPTPRDVEWNSRAWEVNATSVMLNRLGFMLALVDAAQGEPINLGDRTLKTIGVDEDLFLYGERYTATVSPAITGDYVKVSGYLDPHPLELFSFEEV